MVSFIFLFYFIKKFVKSLYTIYTNYIYDMNKFSYICSKTKKIIQ